MKKYISIIPLGESATDFAIQLGIIAIQNDKYICNALDESGELLHEQTFALKKSVEGIPLQADALDAWIAHQTKIKQVQNTESETE